MSNEDPTKDLDTRALLLQLRDQFERFDARQREFDARQREFDARQREFDTRLSDLQSEVSALSKKVDERLYDTRPMWEAVQSQVSELREEMEKGFRKLDSKGELLAREFRDLFAEYRELERRVGNIESKVS